MGLIRPVVPPTLGVILSTSLAETRGKDEPREEEGTGMARGTLYLPALIAGAVLMACVAAVLAVSEKAEATFPGKNGRIAYARGGAPDSIEIYTMKAGGGGRFNVTDNITDDFEPSWGSRHDDDDNDDNK